MMLKIGLALAMTGVLTLTAGNASAVETVTLLDRGEPYEAMVAEDGVLWVGQSRRQFNADYRLEAYRSDGTLIDRIPLTHSINVIKSAVKGTVMVTGISSASRLSQYTLARIENGKIKISTREIALGGLITFWIGSLQGRHYFADIGGNPDDTSDPAAGLPAQTIFSSTGSRPEFLPSRVRMPLAGTILNNKLLLVSSEGVGQSAGSLVEVDLRTSATRVVTRSVTAKYRGIEVIPGTANIVTAAWGERMVRVVDSTNGAIRREFPTKGYPRSFSVVGRCVIVGNDETNIVEAFDLNTEGGEPAFAGEVNMPADEFSGIKSIAVDRASGTVFARAANACNPLMEPCDQDNNRVIKFGNDLAGRVLATCN